MKYPLILLVALIVFVAVLVLTLYSRPSQQGSSSGGISLLPAATSTPSPSSVPSNSAVAAALQSHIVQGDQTKLYSNATVGGYALQLWGNANGGGEALLKYETAQHQWTLVSWGGGAWNVADLAEEGVSTDTAVALLANMPH